jgi:predicted  nucleic acid-binding Zn-ribbon protein
MARRGNGIDQPSIGWISIVDGIVFVLIVVLAGTVFVHGELQRTKVALSKANENKNKELERILSEYRATAKMLEDAKKTLAELARENQCLEQQRQLVLKDLKSTRDRLAAVMEELEELTRKGIPELLKEKAELKRRIAEITNTLKSLSAELQAANATAKKLKINLEDTQKQLISARDELKALLHQVADYRARLADIDKQLVDARKAVTELGKEKSELEKRRSELEKKNSELASKNADLEKQKVNAENTIRELTKDCEKRLAYLKENHKAEIAKLQAVVSALRRELGDRPPKPIPGAAGGKGDPEKGVRAELLGLQGNLEHVAIIFDTSGSMGRPFQGVSRWQHAKKIVDVWIKHLKISEGVLIQFNSTVTDVYPVEKPPDKPFLDLKVEANRTLLSDRLATIEPQGGTNTLAALKRAYSYANLDTILLFTDGEPNNGETDTFDDAIAQEIYALVSKHYKENHITVNTIGLGDYFRPELSGFLTRLAKEGGGSFLGR